MDEIPLVRWIEGGKTRGALWQSEAGIPPPNRIVVTDDTIRADRAFRWACEGTSLLWRGDFQNAKQLLNAMAKRVDKRKAGSHKREPSRIELPLDPGIFHRHRLAQSQRARVLGRLLVPLDASYAVLLSRAPDLRAACREAFGALPAGTETVLVSLRELLGVIGAHEWRKRGVEIGILGGRVHPHYGVFAPVRNEYLSLVNEAPWPHGRLPDRAFDIGTGSGVLAAILARRGIPRVVATDLDPRAIACARENVERLKLSASTEIVEADLFPQGRAALVVCNPPWVPARPSSRIESAIFDPESAMLRGFLARLASHLDAGGEGWLILSDLAVHLGLRSPDWLEKEISRCGLVVAGRHDARPTHPKSVDPTDPLHAARANEVTTLWRLRAA